MSSFPVPRFVLLICGVSFLGTFAGHAVRADDDEVVEAAEDTVVEIAAEEVMDADFIEIDFGDDVEGVEIEMGMMVGGDAQSRLRGYARRQRALVLMVCEPTPKQKDALAAIDDKWVTKAIKESLERPAAKPPVRAPNILARFFGARPVQVRRARRNNVDEAQLQAVIDDAIGSVLEESQQALWRTERDAASANYYQATADAVIECLDVELNFSDEQRKEFCETVTPWVEKQDLMITPYFNGNHYVPAVPVHLLKSLHAEQREIFSGLQKVNYTSQNFNDGNQPIIINP